MTLSTLKRAVKATGRDIETEESAVGYERSINLYLNSDTEQFSSSECLCICAVYYDEKGDRADCIERLIVELNDGFEPISRETKYSNGID
jgi:hypothetical protein